MSVAEYQNAIPDIFKGSATPAIVVTSDSNLEQSPSAGGAVKKEDSTPSATEESPKDKQEEGASARKQRGQTQKGFADIVEFHKKNPDSGYDVQIIPTSRFLPKRTKRSTKTPKYADYALVLRRTALQQREGVVLLRFELEIQSRRLCKALRAMLRNCYESTNLQSFPIKFPAPWSELFFYRHDIQNLAEKEDDGSGVCEDAKLLHEFVVTNGLLSSILRDHKNYSKRGQVAGDILWTIYPPNSLAVLKIEGIQECWVVRNVLQIPSPNGGFLWEVTGLRVGCDGKRPGFSKPKCIVAAVTMTLHNVADLPLIPVDYFQPEDWQKVKTVLAARSLRLERTLGASLISFRPQVYQGDAWERNTAGKHYAPSDTTLSQEKQADERVVVDYYSFRNSARSRGQIPEVEDLQDQTQLRKSQQAVRARGIVLKTQVDSSSDSSDSDDWDGEQADTDDSDSEGGSSQNATGSGRRQKKGASNFDEMMDFKSIGNALVEEDAAGSKPKLMADEITIEDLAKQAQDILHISRENFNLLFPACVPAFGLKSKGWIWVMTDGLEDVVWNSTAFQSLQYDQDTKDLVHALITGHKRGLKTGFDDLIAGKGQGLVFLLHGEPGLGKTLTAESIADYLERPLYSISGGEVGTDVRSVENRLNEIFELTKRWDAVSLLDEADVLLCKRNSAELERNAIVGVFLRNLEYLQGVLFLTTNRKKDFDEAFKSRIHVTISYPALSKTAQSTIWQRLIENNKALKLNGAWNDEVYSALGRLNLNGRTIKNLLRTAVAYAYADGDALGLKHVLAMVKTELREFDETVDDENLAKAERSKHTEVLEAIKELQRLVLVDDGIKAHSS
ncbi:hypothetical protein B0T16DRAFT_361024 [Cercophora newfieldiana]|uniref:AAA+ ATPase domain-containing protein n=1 Tax=Cercophora newfieldiana TaxID=92897 RepID=A0AA39XUS6_9PEZI|nr:hypothetical protein B0T16DRAFT_361024 [Cercophora newfieldiana]